MKMFVRGMAVAALAAAISGCGFWGDSEQEVKPAELVSFEAEKSVDVLWSTQVGSGLGKKYHQFVPALWGDQIFASDNKGRVQAFNRTTGERQWDVELDLTIGGGVGAGFDVVALASEDGELLALDAADGSLKWRASLGTEAVAAPQFNAELVVVQLINGRLEAFDRLSGERRWTYDSLVPRLTLRGTSSPLVTLDATIAAFANGKIVALSNANGRVIWERRAAIPEGRSELERMVDIDGRPLLADGRLYIASYQGRLVAVEPRQAQIVWSQNVSSYRSLAAGFGNVYVSEVGDYVQAFDQKSSGSVWRQVALENRMITSPAVLGNTVAVADAQGYVHFMSQVDGHFVARYQVDSSGLLGDMLVADDVLYALSNGGRLVALKLK